MSFKLTGIAAMALLIGVAVLWRNKGLYFSFLALPIFAAAAASAAHKYPFVGRLLLFLVPVLIIFIGAGAGFIWTKTRLAAPLLGALFLVLLLVPPALQAGYHVFRPRMREEVRSVLRDVSRRAQPGDTVYVYYSAWPTYQYYAERGVFKAENVVEGIRSRVRLPRYLEDIDRLRGRKRVWFVFSHSWGGGRIDEEQYVLVHLNEIGTRLHEFRTEGASAFLYDLSKPTPASP